jgi:pyruvate kinase
MKKGMNVARLNFSHGSHKEHLKKIRKIRKASKALKTRVGIMLDTRGPELRLGYFSDEVRLSKGQEFTLTSEQLRGNQERASINHPHVLAGLKKGDVVLVGDRAEKMQVVAPGKTQARLKALQAIELSSRRRLAFPDCRLKLPALSKKDRQDLAFGARHGVDFVAASFVRKASDVKEIKNILKKHGSHAAVIAKIENREGVKNANAIINESDGVMVGRGDLGIEMPLQQVPLIQKKLVLKCRRRGKPVIIATQMLESMIGNPKPTRAEVSDIAQAVWQGTSAVMLSGETAVGKYPVKAVEVMSKVAAEAEKQESLEVERANVPEIPDAIGKAAHTLSDSLPIRLILCFTRSGFTASLISKERLRIPILSLSRKESVLNKMTLYYGVIPEKAPSFSAGTGKIVKAIQLAKKNKLVKKNDLVLVTYGSHVGGTPYTDTLRLFTV